MTKKQNRKGRKIGIFVLIVIILLIGTVLYLRSLFPRPYEEVVNNVSQTYGIETTLIYAVIHAESNFREDAISPAGAKGLMQITDETGEFIRNRLSFEEYTSEDLFKAEINIQMGVHYLDYLSERFSEKRTVLAAYNAGPNRVQKWLDDESMSDGINLNTIPFEETKEYVDRVILRQRIYEVLYWLD